jgi:hypothetical protein
VSARPAVGFLEAAARSKAARKQALEALLSGRTPQQRVAGSGFAHSSGGFDGGRHPPVPPPRDPLRDHDALIAELARWSRVSRSDF